MDKMLFKQKISNSKMASNVFIILILSLFFTIFNYKFIYFANIMDILRNSSFIGLVIIGETIVMIGGGIDLSVGGVACLSAISAAFLMEIVPLPIAILIAILIGIICGLFNSLFIIKFNIPPLIVTLGSMQVFFGLVMVMTEGVPLFSISQQWQKIAYIKLLGIPVPVLILLFIMLVIWYLLKNYKVGRNIYAIGGNLNAAITSGISVNKTKVFMYVSSGILASLAGLIALSWIGSGQPTMGKDWLLRVIAASIIGGATLTGGEGSVIGAITGILMLNIIDNGMTLMNVSPYWRGTFIGIVVVLAILLDVLRNKNKLRGVVS